MSLIPRDSWFNIEPFFNHFLTPDDKDNKAEFFSPRVDITEKDDRYEIVADLPGVKKDDVDVQLHDGILTIEAKTLVEKKSEKDKVIRQERHSGFFRRNFNVGKNLKAEEIEANFKDGVLTLHFHKNVEVPDERRKISIN